MVGVPVLSSRTPLGRVVRVLSKESPHKLRAVRSSVFGTRPNAALRNGNGKRGSYCLLAPAIALTYIRNQEWSDRCGTRHLKTTAQPKLYEHAEMCSHFVDVVHKPPCCIWTLRFEFSLSLGGHCLFVLIRCGATCSMGCVHGRIGVCGRANGLLYVW